MRKKKDKPPDNLIPFDPSRKPAPRSAPLPETTAQEEKFIRQEELAGFLAAKGAAARANAEYQSLYNRLLQAVKEGWPVESGPFEIEVVKKETLHVHL